MLFSTISWYPVNCILGGKKEQNIYDFFKVLQRIFSLNILKECNNEKNSTFLIMTILYSLLAVHLVVLEY